jgi:3-oxoacyl-[acyl-carrier-protein] synthase II
VAVAIAGSAVRTCLGDGAATYAALLDGVSGSEPLRFFDTRKLNVSHGYHIHDETDPPHRAAGWLQSCIADALEKAPFEHDGRRVVAVIGTGLRQLRGVERWHADSEPIAPSDLHFGGAVRAVVPAVAEVVTLANACSGAGHALAIGQDLLESDQADAVIVGGVDEMTSSMLAMIGRVSGGTYDSVRPFDARRAGVLLGEGAAAVVLVPDDATPRPLGRLLATGLSCDAHHETAPALEGIERAVNDALNRADVHPSSVDLVLAHGTGTTLNDPTEAAALLREFDGGDRPMVTALKGALGHTSGASALHSLDVALRAMEIGVVPPIVGLTEQCEETLPLDLVDNGRRHARVRIAQVNAFGFGGVNAVTLVGAAA